MLRLIYIGVRSEAQNPNITAFELTLSRLGDWARLNPYNWYVWTDRSAQDVFEELRIHLYPNDSIMVAPIVPDEVRGRVPTWLVNWVEEKGTGPKSLLTKPKGLLPKN